MATRASARLAPSVDRRRDRQPVALGPRPGSDQGRVVISGHHHHLATGHPLSDRAQDRLRLGQRAAGVTRDQLDQVAQQDEAVDAVQRLEQPRQRHRLPQDVVLRAAAKMEIGDDQRSQAGGR